VYIAHRLDTMFKLTTQPVRWRTIAFLLAPQQSEQWTIHILLSLHSQ
jgi:hypothetical protein